MTAITIKLDPTIDEGVYVCPRCANKHAWVGLVDEHVETDGIDYAPLCYNCGRQAWFTFTDDVVAVLEHYRAIYITINGDEKYSNGARRTIKTALHFILDDLVDESLVPDSMIEDLIDYTDLTVGYPWAAKANTFRELAFDGWTYL